jgi:outer membrane protein TolC
MSLEVRNLFQFILLVGIFFVSGRLNFAQTIAPDSALQVILNELEGTELLLSEASDLAQKNSTSLGKAKAVYLASLGVLKRERGYFDPELYFNLYYSDLQVPTASYFSGADVLLNEETTSQTGLKLNLPIGTQLELSLNTFSLNTNSQFAFLNPQYNAFGSFSFRQPLLGGFSSTGRRELTRAEFGYEAAKANYDQELLVVNSEVEKAYWNLYAAERDYGVQKLVRDRAKEFLTETETREQAGIVGPSQVANAKTFLAEQELLLIDQDEALASQSDLVAVLIGKRPESGLTRFKTVNDPPQDFPVETAEILIDYALESNLQLQAVKKEIDVANSLVDAAGWEVLPTLDFIGSISSTGIGGDSQPVIFGSDTLSSTSGGSFNDMLKQVIKREYPGWSVGVELSLPIGFRSDIGEKERLEAVAFIAEQQYVELSRTIEESVRKAHRELSHGNMRLKAATDGVEAAQEQVRIGVIEFQNGRITAFELVRLGEDFAKAQRRYSEALVRTVNAVAMLRQLTAGKYPENLKF